MNDGITIAKLTAENDELEHEVDFLEYRLGELETELAGTFAPSADHTPGLIFTALRRDLAGWPMSYWRALERLVHHHVEQGG
jgi:hypothetical protein